MGRTLQIQAPLNRVEGDLEVRVELEDSVVTNAWCAGTMYRGFERIMLGRAPLDGLVVTPRVCGICSTAHLTAAARALDALSCAEIPPDAVRVRNVALMIENAQSDVRHAFLLWAVDFTSPIHAEHPLHAEAVRRYAALRGETAVETIRHTKQLVEVVALLGGQWPHSSYMVPGGITSRPSSSELAQCRHIVRRFRLWYERRVLGCSIERWTDEVQSAAGLDGWLDARAEHRESDLGFMLRFARQAGLERVGRGPGGFLSFGALDIPEGSSLRARDGGALLVPSGYAGPGGAAPFLQEAVAEHTAWSWFRDDQEARHPSRGETVPYATGSEGTRYSWAKAPRYDGRPAETGPLAEAVVAGDLLFADLLRVSGPSALLRELARLTRPIRMLPALEAWLAETRGDGETYRDPGPPPDGAAFGLTHAARGALGHWIEITHGEITRYQIITPTAWNASPRDVEGVRGPIEEALIGARVRDPSDPVELGHIVRSFDPCLVCTVHALERPRRRRGRS